MIHKLLFRVWILCLSVCFVLFYYHAGFLSNAGIFIIFFFNLCYSKTQYFKNCRLYIYIIVFVLNVNFRNSKLLKYVLYLLLKAHITKHNGVAQCTEKRTVELEKIKITILETTYTKKDKMRACVRGFLCVCV